MENSDKSQTGMQTQAKRNDSVEMDALNETCVSGTSGVFAASTAHLADIKTFHVLEKCKLKILLQREKIDDLTEERDYLREQLASALKRKIAGSSRAIPLSSDSSIDSSESSSDTMPDFSSTTSSEWEKKRKRIKMIGKGKKYGKKSKKM